MFVLISNPNQLIGPKMAFLQNHFLFMGDIVDEKYSGTEITI